MIAFTQFTAPANCSEIFAHLHNVTLVASDAITFTWDTSDSWKLFGYALIFLGLPAAVGICWAIVLWKHRK